MPSFYSKERTVSGVRIRAHRDVSDAALDVAAARVHRLLADCVGVRANLADAGAELHVIGKDQAVTDLPMYRHLKGVPFEGDLTIDQRGRGYGGLHACCAEESLLCLPTARHHADHRDVCTHEVAHTVLMFGVDDRFRATFDARYAETLREGRWNGAYAATNVHELFAEATMWYVGSRGDYGRIRPVPHEGPSWLLAHDPQTFGLLDDLYRGRTVPDRAVWEVLLPTDLRRSIAGDRTTTVVFVNHTDVPLERYWLDYRGVARSYGQLPAGGVVSQATWVSHVWRITDAAGADCGCYVAGPRPGRVDVRTPSV